MCILAKIFRDNRRTPRLSRREGRMLAARPLPVVFLRDYDDRTFCSHFQVKLGSICE